MKKKRVMFIASTGGHFSELLQLDTLFKNYDYILITDKDPFTQSFKKKYKMEFLVHGTKDHLLKYLFIFPYNIIKSFYFYCKYRPKYIVTTGTHSAVPSCYIGKIFGSKIIFIETFANSTTKTLAGKLVYPIADLFIVQWESMLTIYSKATYGGWIY